ncbi:hypothetical protein GCM10011329_11060 [Stakelama pacifica]|nr:hypothetical protein GCM10011329_11060 [Stakelama pacifica]
MILQDRVFDLGERGFHRLHLIENVEAVAIVLDHLREAADLSFYSPQAVHNGTAHSVVLKIPL